MLMRILTIFPLFVWAANVWANETVENAARLARKLVESQSLGILSSTYPANDTHLAGRSFGLPEYYAPCYQNGSLSIIFFNIAQNGQNILKSSTHAATIIVQAPSFDVSKARVAIMGNVTLMSLSSGKTVEECYVDRHPDAKGWIPREHGGFHDVSWARFDPIAVYYVGGFGGEHFIGYIPLKLYQEATPTRIHEAEPLREQIS